MIYFFRCLYLVKAEYLLTLFTPILFMSTNANGGCNSILLKIMTAITNHKKC